MSTAVRAAGRGVRLWIRSLPWLAVLGLGSARAQQEAAPPACPPCQCECSYEVPVEPPPPDVNPSQLLTGTLPITVGTGAVWQPIVSGPLILTTVSATCPVAYGLRQGGADEVLPIAPPSGRFLLPAGASLEVTGASGYCVGTVAFSGFRL